MADTVRSEDAAPTGLVSVGQVDSWSGGFVAHAELTALDSLDGWTIVIAMEARITNIWGARIVSRSGDLYTIEAESWNGRLAEGQSAGFGFQAAGSAPEFTITSVNGLTPGGDPPPPEPGPLPVLDLADATATEGGTARLRLTLSEASDTDITFTWGLDGGTAGSADHSAAPGTLTIRAGETEAWIEVPLADDAIVEGTETLGIRLLSAEGATPGRDSATLTVLDNDLPGLSIADASAAEEDGIARLRVSLSAPAQQDVTVTWGLAPGGSADGSDHGAAGGTLTFAAGAREAFIEIPLLDDTLAEPDETLRIALLSATGAEIVTGTATLTIRDGDSAPEPDPEPGGNLPEVDFSVSSSWQGGFNGQIVLTNDTDSPLAAWTIGIDDPGFSITNAWGARVETAPDGDISLVGEGWTLDLAPGQSVTFGFTASGSVPGALALDIDTGETPTPEPDPDPLPEPDPDPDPGPDPDPDPSADTPFGAQDYEEALSLSMQFYYAQYSGDLPDDFPLDWRGDSALSDGADVGRDLSGGWYDAGDHVKFGLPMAYSASVLAWGAADYAEGYKASGSYEDILAHLEWVTDYFLRAYDDKGTADLSDDVFWAQVGNGGADHAWWGAPEDMSMARPAYAVTAQAPGTEVTAETAAALAASAIVFRAAGREAEADELLAAARKLFAFSEAYQGTYTNAVPDAAGYYNSWSGYQDELAWSAAWLHRATGEADYLAKAEDWYSPTGLTWALSWDNKSMGTAALLAGQTDASRYYTDLGRHIDHWMNDLTRTPGTDTNAGLAWLDTWGSNRYATTTAFLAMEYADLTEARGGGAARVGEVIDFAADQLDYVLGDNPDGQSYVVGFGDDYPLNPHHRGASGTTSVSDPAPNAHVLYGALVGGPDAGGTYSDLRSDYISNEVATDYNAGFSGALAALIMQQSEL
ncbi:glycoside hydrolase family 9 protein [Oceanicella sp. SM1341]|uniref:glycoside hydrolase family 9 protein n=1 Tax=Oceanicella sp. SM1341 TaxID=1548889 RepID=UPI0018E59BC0|nr:glycoside hydrolase family 9 protein [Oceanicella sp. SM1341]